MHPTRRTRAAKAALLCAAMLWGGGFVVTKQTLDILPPFWLMAYRFTLATAAVSLLRPGAWKRLDVRALMEGAVLGGLLFLGYLVQTFGLAATTPGKNAFLTAMYVVWAPFLYWLAMGKRPKLDHLLAAALALAGLALISLTESLRIGGGDALTLQCSLLFAGHIVGLVWLQRRLDIDAVLLLQFGWATVFFWIVALCSSPPPPVKPEAIGALLYLGLVSTLLATSLQTIGQRYTPPAHASLLLSTEAVFGCVFSAIFWGERFSARTLYGFACVLGAVLISEIGPIGRARARS